MPAAVGTRSSFTNIHEISGLEWEVIPRQQSREITLLHPAIIIKFGIAAVARRGQATWD